MKGEKTTKKELPNVVINKIKNFLIPSDSDEYRRMLAGIRVYFSFMSQRNFINSTFSIFLIVFSISIFLGVSYLIKGEEIPFFPLISFGLFYPLFGMGLSLLTSYIENDFSIKKGIFIFVKNRMIVFIIMVYSSMILFMILTLNIIITK